MERRLCQFQRTSRICGNRTHRTQMEQNGARWESQHPGGESNRMNSVHIYPELYGAPEDSLRWRKAWSGRGLFGIFSLLSWIFHIYSEPQNFLRLLSMYFNSLPYVTNVYEVAVSFFLHSPLNARTRVRAHTNTHLLSKDICTHARARTHEHTHLLSKDIFYIFLMFPTTSTMTEPTRTNAESIICFYIFAVYIRFIYHI